MTPEAFQQLAPGLPHQPGIYKYLDAEGKLIYVGKAKDLRKRIGSYFVKRPDNFKTRKLVENIRHIEFTIVNSEQDAFLLENSLIKEFRPKYNINLKDDKSYPFIVIKNEPFPRVFLTRRHIPDGSEYLGPFTGAGKVRELLEFVRTYIPLRTCGLNLSEQNIRRGRFRVCLEYHLGNCKGPCEGLQTQEDYREGLQQIRHILKGNLAPVIQRFREQMDVLAAQLEFEKAEQLRKKIAGLQAYQARSAVVNARVGDLDVCSILSNEQQAYVNYLMVRNGAVVQTKTILLEKKLEESAAEILLFAIAHLREKLQSDSAEIVAPFSLSYPDPSVKITVPRGGDKKKLLDLSLKNVEYFREALHKRKILRLEGEGETDRQQTLFQLQQDLQLPELPVHIECFDNSNFQGSFPVSACVVFRNGLPSKSDYRHFNIKTVAGINDFASMAETVYRRYKRMMAEGQPLPQLVIIDGGKGQLSAALESIGKLGLAGRMTVVGLAKNVEEIFFPGDRESWRLPYESDSLRLIRRIRDEVHRFGITFHRNQRSRGTFKNELGEIPGIGKNTAELLLKTFRSVKHIQELTQREIAKEIGTQPARIVWEYFHPEEGNL